MALSITSNNIEEVLTNNKIIVLQFSAPWCGPCRMLSPIIDSLVNDNEDIVIGKVDVDSEVELSQKYSVRGIPTILFIKNGEVVDKVVGVDTKSNLQLMIDKIKF
jgi:thioredoxin 1